MIVNMSHEYYDDCHYPFAEDHRPVITFIVICKLLLTCQADDDNIQIMKKITFRLQKVLTQKGMSVQAAADATSISRPTLYALRDGKADGLKFETLEKLVNGLNVTICDLIEVEQTKTK
jgi:DNA-binding Xre family transcriptional regulator